MTDVLQTAIEYLDAQRKAYVSQSISYVRGATTLSIVGTPDQREFQIQTMDGTITTTLSTSWIVTAADITALAPPQRGDQIKWVDGATTYVYEVMGPGGGPVFEDWDSYKTAYVIHTKAIGTA